MPITKDQVRMTAQAIVETLDQLTAKERARHPMMGYAKELNKLIELGKEAAPDVDPRLWPEPIRMEEFGGAEQVFGTFEDVLTAARRIVGLLPKDIFLGAL